jgi:hypothetical protein
MKIKIILFAMMLLAMPVFAFDVNNVATYNFSETSGNVLDASGNEYKGTFNGTGYIQGISAFINKGLYFSTSNTYVTVADNAALRTANFTIEAWVSFNETPSSDVHIIAQKHNEGNDNAGYTLAYIYATDAFCTGDSNSFAIITETPRKCALAHLIQVINTTYYVAATYDGTNIKIYVNGNLINTTAATYVASTYPIRIGEDGTNSRFQFKGTVDELWLSNIPRNAIYFNAIYLNYTTGYSPSIAPNVTIYLLNTTYFNPNNFNLSFSSAANSSIYKIYAYLNNSLIYSNTSYKNNTIISIFRNLTQGNYNFTIVANDTLNQTTNTSIAFSIGVYSPTFIFEQNPYETETYNISIFYNTNFNLISNITAILIWNETNKGEDYQTVNSTGILNTKQITMPLLQSNSTNFTFYWSAIVTYVNGTVIYYNTSNNSQYAQFAYFMSNTSAQWQNNTNLIEYDYLYNTVTLTYAKTYAIIYVNTTLHGNITQLSQLAYGSFANSIDAGTISESMNQSYNVTSIAYISFQNNTRTLTTENDSIMVYKIIMSDCSTGSNATTQTLFLVLKDEKTDALVNGNIRIGNNISFNGRITRMYPFNFTGVDNASLCIYPKFATYTDKAMLQYGATSYSTRTYFINSPINNVSQTVNLFLLDSTYSYSVVFFLRDRSNNPIPNLIIKVQKYDVGTNTYNAVSQCQSDNPDGKCATFLEVLDTYYNFIIENGTQTILQTTPTQIVCQPFESITFCPPYPIRIQISTSALSVFSQITEKINTNCYSNPITSIFKCTIDDTSGLMTNSTFIVNKKGALLWTNLCNSSDITSSVTYTCNLLNISASSFYYILSGTVSGISIVLDNGYITPPIQPSMWGYFGFFAAMLLTLTMFFAGIDNPAKAIVFAALGLIFSAMMGLLSYNINQFISPLIGVILALAIVVWKVRS